MTWDEMAKEYADKVQAEALEVGSIDAYAYDAIREAFKQGVIAGFELAQEQKHDEINDLATAIARKEFDMQQTATLRAITEELFGDDFCGDD